MEAVTTALANGIGGMATEVMEAVGSIVPKALPIVGAVMVVTIGIKVFKKVASK